MRKIDLYKLVNGEWRYFCSTAQSKTCKEAKAIAEKKFGVEFKARFSTKQ